LDAFNARHPQLFRKVYKTGSDWMGTVLDRIGELDLAGFKVALRERKPKGRDDWKSLGDHEFFGLVRKSNLKLLFIVDEFPDLILNMKRNHPDLVRPFLGWFRGHCLNPHPKSDTVRWLLGGSVNLSSTLDAIGSIDLINALHEERLPVLTTAQVCEFVVRMLSERKVDMDSTIPSYLAEQLGRPVPYFLQMLTQILYRIWKREPRPLVQADVKTAFQELIVSSAARDKLQHFYSRIQQYYDEPKRSAAYVMLARLSLSPQGLHKTKLGQVFDQVSHEQGTSLPEHERKRQFLQLLRDLENDFYVSEISDGQYEFASGVLKAWWRKYYA
jgi:uncharacterized protein